MKSPQSKPASQSQVSYAKHLIDQAVRGVRGVPGWLPKEEALDERQLASMDQVAISTLIDSLKSRRPFEVERFGDGSYRVVQKHAHALRVARVFAMKLALDTKKWGPFEFKIDRPKGFKKEWPQEDGSTKEYTYPCDYGYFLEHTGEDNEGLDAFIGDDPEGKIESFLKMKPSEDGETLVPDETKFLIGLSDAERKKVLDLYDPEMVVGLREFEDVYELIAFLNAFRDRKAAARIADRVAARHLSAVAAKYEDIDFKPPKSVADAAKKGLEYREKASPSNKGGLTPAEASEQGIGSGVQRAVNLKNRDNVTPETISKMVGFFARHEKNKGVSAENRDEPWNDKGHVSWLLWGGDPGKSWAEKLKAQMEKADEAARTASRQAAHIANKHLARS